MAVTELAYVTVSHVGFDGAFHTGEIIVNVAVADDIVEVFRSLHDARFPIEQMRVITKEEIDAPPTGDWNDTTSFVCRPAVGSGSWSRHAYGLAIDINPFHNPYVKADLVLPELASAYLDRDDVRSGMIVAGRCGDRSLCGDRLGMGRQLAHAQGLDALLPRRRVMAFRRGSAQSTALAPRSARSSANSDDRGSTRCSSPRRMTFSPFSDCMCR